MCFKHDLISGERKQNTFLKQLMFLITVRTVDICVLPSSCCYTETEQHCPLIDIIVHLNSQYSGHFTYFTSPCFSVKNTERGILFTNQRLLTVDCRLSSRGKMFLFDIPPQLLGHCFSLQEKDSTACLTGRRLTQPHLLTLQLILYFQ